MYGWCVLAIFAGENHKSAILPMENEYYIIGESDMKDFTLWWESHLPAYIVVYCCGGEAKLRL